MIKLIGKIFACAFVVNVSSAYSASTGTIYFNGMVTDNTCNVSVDGQGHTGTIELPHVSTSDLKSIGDISGKTNFNLVLTDCIVGVGNDKKVSAFFQQGETVDSTTGRLKQTSNSGAQNISLVLSDSVTNNDIFVGDQNQLTNNTFKPIDANGQAVLPYAVAYYAEGEVSAGNVTSSVVYNLQYK